MMPPHLVLRFSIRLTSAFASFLSVNQFIQIPTIHLESFAKLRVWKLAFPDQLSHGP